MTATPSADALLAAMEAAARDAGAEQWTLYLGEDGDPIAVVTYDPQPSKRLHVVSHPLYPKDRAKAERRTLFVATANPAAVLQLCAALRASQEREAQAVAERDEADRRAGAAERRNEQLREDAFRRSQWLRKAKEEAGYDDDVSFDVVWRDALAAIHARKDAAP